MTERRTLVEGLKQTPTVDPKVEKDFVFKSKPPASDEGIAKNSSIPAVSSSALSTRIRSDIATSLKRASLERQLEGLEPNSVKEILEEVLEPWLRNNGYLT